MSSTVGLGVPKLLPVTSTFALPLTGYFALLSWRVVLNRLKHKKRFSTTIDKPEDKPDGVDPLTVAVRCHGNFAENVPLALLLSAFAELNGANRQALSVILSIFFVARVLHAEAGLKTGKGMGAGRATGHATTLLTLFGLSAYSAWLVKGYWGL